MGYKPTGRPNGVRRNLPWDVRTREKIRATLIIERLQQHFFGESIRRGGRGYKGDSGKMMLVELTMAQIRIAEILLRTCVPDLTATAMQAEITHRYVAELPTVLSREEWERKYGPNATLQ